MHIIYKITYIPHLGTDLPKWYIGSKYNYSGNYLGSVSSQQVFNFTEGLTLKDWWKRETYNNPQYFLFEIIDILNDNITPTMLVEKERDVHVIYDVLNNDYFNQSIATTGFCSVKKSELTKHLISEKTKRYWDSPEGQEKRNRLIQRNKEKQSALMQQRWSDPKISARLHKRVSEAASRPKSTETKRRMSESKKKKIEYQGEIYNGWDDLKAKTGMTKYKYLKKVNVT